MGFVNNKGNKKIRRGMNGKAGKGDFFESEFDLVQNNGRVTLPAGSSGPHLTAKQLFVVLGASLLLAALIRRR